jgi:phosphoribosyl 1,2-cyclic phosphodiesterase
MRVRFWGVRGSLPVPGARTERYGGNTSCVEVTSASGTRIIIDGGTGIRRLGKELMRTEFESGKGQAHILVSHTHWDHIQGLPFFSPFYRDGNRMFVYARQRDDQNLRSVFASQADAPFFPVSFDRTRASVSFRELHDGAKFEIEDMRVSTTRLNHPHVATAYAIVADGARVAYISDTAPFSDILFGQEFLSGPPLPQAEVDGGSRRALMRRRRSGHLRHHVHGR